MFVPCSRAMSAFFRFKVVAPCSFWVSPVLRSPLAVKRRSVTNLFLPQRLDMSSNPQIRLEKITFDGFRKTLNPPLVSKINDPRFFLNPASKLELLRSIASLDVTVNPHSVRLEVMPPSLVHLDKKAVPFLRDADVRGALEIITAWFDKLEHHIRHLRSFDEFVHNARKHATAGSLEDLVTLLFFVGMSKRNKVGETRELCKIAERRFDLEFKAGNGRLLSEEGIALVSVNLHKLNHIFTSPQLLTHLLESVLEMTSDVRECKPGSLFGVIACLKMLRHSRYCPDSLCARIAELLRVMGKDLNLTELYHLTASLANVNYLDKAAMEIVGGRLRELLMEFSSRRSPEDTRAHPSQLIRVKDVQGIVWACASLGHLLDDGTVSAVKKFLLDTYSESDPSWPSVYVDALYALINMGHHFMELAQKVMKPKVVRFYIDEDMGRMLTKMWIVETAMNIELNAKLDVVSGLATNRDVPFRPVRKDVDQRPAMKEMFVQLKAEQKATRDPFDMDALYVVPRISIAGLKLNLKRRRNQVVYVEVLDSTMVTKPGREPLGLMKLKLRLMQKLKLKVITLTEAEIRNHKPDMFKYILRKI